VLWDERSTTVQAYRNLLAADVSGKKKRGLIDSEAARIILDSYLSFRRNQRQKEE
ncbi:MAG: Holliday junction resolvase RuvX, partial [Oscillospiraceae bacterium]|nr:Holliday junction resolvase RuvX [Oscillospiraceae bacterium]